MTTINDAANPFFIHHSDNTSLVLVSKPLDGTNYLSWRRSMMLALDGRNKLGFVDGTIKKPDSTDAVKLRLWSRNDSIVASWILNSLTKEISASVIYSSSTSSIWNDLERRFNIKNGPHIFQLKKSLSRCNQGNDSLTTYYTRFKAIWAELGELKAVHTCTCNGVAPLLKSAKEEHVMDFLMGLNESFNHACGQILLMKPIPEIDEAFSLLLQDETQRSIGNHASPNTEIACAVPQTNSRGRNPRKDRPLCSHCNIHGHTKEKCFKLHGFPPGFKKSSNNAAATVNNVVDGGTSDQVEATWSQEQCQQILAMLQTQMANLSANSSADQADSAGT